MKIRNGFVSNSSSSSFVIAVKDKDVNKFLQKYLIDKSNPFSPLIQDAIEVFVNNIDYCFTNIEDYKQKMMIKDEEITENSYHSFAPKLLEKFGKFYVGSLDSDERGLEEGLMNVSFKIDNNDIYFESNGGF